MAVSTRRAPCCVCKGVTSLTVEECRARVQDGVVTGAGRSSRTGVREVWLRDGFCPVTRNVRGFFGSYMSCFRLSGGSGYRSFQDPERTVAGSAGRPGPVSQENPSAALDGGEGEGINEQNNTTHPHCGVLFFLAPLPSHTHTLFFCLYVISCVTTSH